MEKLGVGDEELLRELKSEYQRLRQQEAENIKTGSVNRSIPDQMAAVKSRIDELEAKEKGD